MKSEAPAPPNYAAAAEATAAGSERVTNQQNYANRPDQTNPWGSLTWDTQQIRDPATGQMVTKWSQNQTLDPNLQGALDSQIDVQRGRSDLAKGMMGGASNELGTPMDYSQYGDMLPGVAYQGIDMSGLPQGTSSITPGNYTAPELQKSIDYSGATNVGGAEDQRNRAEDALYSRQLSRLDPQYAQSDQAIEVKLRNQGLKPGDEAWDNAMQNYNMSKNDAYSNAMLDSIIKGGDEASRTFNMDMSKRNMETGEIDRMAGFGNNALSQQSGLDLATGGQTYSENLGAGNFNNMARQQALAEQIGIKDRDYQMANQDVNNTNALRTATINEDLARRGTSLNEINALLTGQQVQLPNMAPVTMASKASAPDYLTAANMQNNANYGQYSANQAANQGFMSGLTNTISSGLGFFSDRSLKKNIKKIGALFGYGIYKFQYLWGEWGVGVMADEVNADAVTRHASGYDIVDYGKVA